MRSMVEGRCEAGGRVCRRPLRRAGRATFPAPRGRNRCSQSPVKKSEGLLVPAPPPPRAGRAPSRAPRGRNR
jgi:hypothetical protein